MPPATDPDTQAILDTYNKGLSKGMFDPSNPAYDKDAATWAHNARAAGIIDDPHQGVIKPDPDTQAVLDAYNKGLQKGAFDPSSPNYDKAAADWAHQSRAAGIINDPMQGGAIKPQSTPTSGVGMGDLHSIGDVNASGASTPPPPPARLVRTPAQQRQLTAQELADVTRTYQTPGFNMNGGQSATQVPALKIPYPNATTPAQRQANADATARYTVSPPNSGKIADSELRAGMIDTGIGLIENQIRQDHAQAKLANPNLHMSAGKDADTVSEMIPGVSSVRAAKEEGIPLSQWYAKNKPAAVTDVANGILIAAPFVHGGIGAIRDINTPMPGEFPDEYDAARPTASTPPPPRANVTPMPSRVNPGTPTITGRPMGPTAPESLPPPPVAPYVPKLAPVQSLVAQIGKLHDAGEPIPVTATNALIEPARGGSAHVQGEAIAALKDAGYEIQGNQWVRTAKPAAVSTNASSELPAPVANEPAVATVAPTPSAPTVDAHPAGPKPLPGGISVNSLDPSTIKLREKDQSEGRLDNVRSMYDDDATGEVHPPITTYSDDGKHTVIDGHHRVIVANEKGVPVQSVDIPKPLYDYLKAKDFDDIEISEGMLQITGHGDAAESLHHQFAGAGVRERGYDVTGAIDEYDAAHGDYKPDESAGHLASENAETGIPATAETASPTPKDEVNDFIADQTEKYPGVKFDIEHGARNNDLTLSRVVVPKESRGTGVGTRFMQDLVDFADRTGRRIKLSPSTDFGGSSVPRLKAFYKRFGFVENKGSGKDFAISDTMYRDPKSAPVETGNPVPKDEPTGSTHTTDVKLSDIHSRPDTEAPQAKDTETDTAAKPTEPAPYKPTVAKEIAQKAHDRAEQLLAELKDIHPLKNLGSDAGSGGGETASLFVEKAAKFIEYGGARIVEGLANFADWSAHMIATFGDEIKPHLADFWEKAQDNAAKFVKGEEGNAATEPTQAKVSKESEAVAPKSETEAVKSERGPTTQKSSPTADKIKGVSDYVQAHLRKLDPAKIKEIYDAARARHATVYSRDAETVRKAAADELDKGLDVNELSQPTSDRVSQGVHEEMQRQAMNFFYRTLDGVQSELDRMDRIEQAGRPLTEQQATMREGLQKTRDEINQTHDRISAGYAAAGTATSDVFRARKMVNLAKSVIRDVSTIKLMSRAAKEETPRGPIEKAARVVTDVATGRTPFDRVHNRLRTQLSPEKFARLEEIRKNAAERAKSGAGCPGL